jgi:sulfite exporter TauE/SafE
LTGLTVGAMEGQWTFFGAILVGLLGSGHCVGMCGGIVGVMAMNAVPGPGSVWRRTAATLAAYNLGRIASYTAAGGLAGLLGAGFGSLLPPAAARYVAATVSGLFFIALGLYLTGWWTALTVLERQGARIWKHIEPLGRRLLPPKNWTQALSLGALWGWLPCGLVYSALVWAFASADSARGAALMLGFGLGTLPTLLATGAAARSLNHWVKQPWVRTAVGLLLAGFGLYLLARGVAGGTAHVH